jgi:hypothetical protein
MFRRTGRALMPITSAAQAAHERQLLVRRSLELVIQRNRITLTEGINGRTNATEGEACGSGYEFPG